MMPKHDSRTSHWLAFALMATLFAYVAAVMPLAHASCSSPGCANGCKELNIYCFDYLKRTPPVFDGAVQVRNNETVAVHFFGPLLETDDEYIELCSQDPDGIRPLDTVVRTLDQYEECEAECPDDWFCPGTAVNGDIIGTDVDEEMKRYCYDPS